MGMRLRDIGTLVGRSIRGDVMKLAGHLDCEQHEKLKNIKHKKKRKRKPERVD